MNHLTHQLKTPEQHFTEIAQTIALASENIATNVYLEDWSNGMRNSQTTYFNS
jgi:D-citramalate synthase